MHHRYIECLVNLLDPAGNLLFNTSLTDAEARVASGDVEQVREIDGQFAILQKVGNTVRMARSISRPMRYFLAKQTDGPCLIVAERIDEIADFLRNEGLYGQFHPSYTRMVPAHHLVELELIGCPDPNPQLTRFFTPQRNRWESDRDELGRQYIQQLAVEIDRWLESIDPQAPLGVLFSGGVDSGAVLLTLHHVLLQRGEAPQRLKAFTLAVDGQGEDPEQAARFLQEVGLSYLLEVINVPAGHLDYREAVATIEDYKPLDVQAAAMTLALCRGIRERYPDWRYLIDGDGGDENLKDYPIEENPELTIRSVLNNLMLYQEGWGVNAVKHSLTYSGGQSRGHVRSHAPARRLGFIGFSPFALPNVIEVAEGIPFIELTGWDESELYRLKGDLVRRGVQEVTGIVMPVHEKRRFQHGSTDEATFRERFPAEERSYRNAFAELYADASR